MDEGDLGRPVTGALGRYTRDLTRDAREGRLEPVRCRDEEVARVIDILLRHGKNNPALVGPAGVGKTAIAEALAQRLAVATFRSSCGPRASWRSITSPCWRGPRIAASTKSASAPSCTRRRPTPTSCCSSTNCTT
jgi:hypothetical protein